MGARTDFLLLPEKEDWCGKLWGHCLKCSGLDAKDFKRLQRNRWHVRAKALFAKRDRMRVLDWQSLDAHLKEKFPGSTNKERRALAMFRIRAMGMAAAKAAFQESENTQKAYTACHEAYMHKIDEVCENIGMPSAQIKHWETDFLTSVCKSIQVSYLCRKKDCGFYGMNDQWVQHATKYHFRCPHCAMQYYPWKDAPKWYPFQKVISVSHPGTGERWVIPALWPASAEDSWLQDMMQATASKIESEDDLEAFLTGKIQSLEVLLSNAGIPAVFKKFTMKQDVKWLLDSAAGFGQTQYGKLAEEGYWGNILDPKLGNQEPFDQWEEFAAIFASLHRAGEQMVSKMKV